MKEKEHGVFVIHCQNCSEDVQLHDGMRSKTVRCYICCAVLQVGEVEKEVIKNMNRIEDHEERIGGVEQKQEAGPSISVLPPLCTGSSRCVCPICISMMSAGEVATAMASAAVMKAETVTEAFSVVMATGVMRAAAKGVIRRAEAREMAAVMLIMAEAKAEAKRIRRAEMPPASVPEIAIAVMVVLTVLILLTGVVAHTIIYAISV